MEPISKDAQSLDLFVYVNLVADYFICLHALPQKAIWLIHKAKTKIKRSTSFSPVKLVSSLQDLYQPPPLSEPFQQ